MKHTTEKKYKGVNVKHKIGEKNVERRKRACMNVCES